MFHTAFTDDFTLRFYRNDIDGGNKDCFPEDFMVDIFFTSHLGETNVVPKNVKMAALKKKSKEINEYLNVEEEEEEEEEKVDRELIDKYKPHFEHSSEEDEDFDDYFQQLELAK